MVTSRRWPSGSRSAAESRRCSASWKTQLPCAARQRLPLCLRSVKSDGSLHCTLTGPSSGRLRGASGSVTLRTRASTAAAANTTTRMRRRRAARVMSGLLGKHPQSAPARLNAAENHGAARAAEAVPRGRGRLRSRRAGGTGRHDAGQPRFPDRTMTRFAPLLALLLFATALAPAAPELTAEAVNAASGDAPGALLRAQVLLERARFSPGQIDGGAGDNTSRAIAGFQRARGLEPTGQLDQPTWQALERDAAPALVTYTLVEADVAGPFRKTPDDMMAQAK